MLTVLVTGGTGFIGSHLIDRLVQTGHKVLAPIRKTSSTTFLPSQGVESREVDLLDSGQVTEIMKGMDVVFHLASIRGRGWGFEDEEVQKVNVGITENLLKASSARKVLHYIYISSVSVYGRPNGGPIDENHTCSPVTRYGRTKYESERLVKEFHRREGLSTTIIRPVITYGPRDTWGMIPKLITLIDSRKYLTVGNGKNRVHLIYIDDLIRGLMLVMTNSMVDGQTYILAGEEPVSIDRLTNIVSLALERKVPDFHIPKSFSLIAAYLMEIFYRFLPVHKEPFITLDKIDIMSRDRYFNVDKAKRDLGFLPGVGYEDGLKKTVDWLRAS